MSSKSIGVGRPGVLCQTIRMIKFTIQAEADELKRLKAELPEAVKAASSKSKTAEARVVRIQKRIQEIEGE